MAQKLTGDNFDYKRFTTLYNKHTLSLFHANSHLSISLFVFSVFLQTFLVGPTLHIWYSTVFKLVPGSGMINTLKRVALDQGCFAPLFITTFITANLLITGKTIEEVYSLHFIQLILSFLLSHFLSFVLLLLLNNKSSRSNIN